MSHYDLIFRQIVTTPSLFFAQEPLLEGIPPEAESTSRFLFSDPHDEQMDRNWVVQYSLMHPSPCSSSIHSLLGFQVEVTPFHSNS